MPAPPTAGAAAVPAPSFAQVQAIVQDRCAMCHNAQLPSKNVRLDSPDAIVAQARAVHQQAVVLKVMPMNNATQMTDAERAAIGRWFESGGAGR